MTCCHWLGGGLGGSWWHLRVNQKMVVVAIGYYGHVFGCLCSLNHVHQSTHKLHRNAQLEHTCVSFEEEDTCISYASHARAPPRSATT